MTKRRSVTFENQVLVDFQDAAFHDKWYNKAQWPCKLPDDSWYRYAKSVQLDTTKNGEQVWTVTMPKGFRLYNGSKSTPLAHAEYPVRDNVRESCGQDKWLPNTKDNSWKNGCTQMSYFSLPKDLAYYAVPFDEKKLNPQIREAYGTLSNDKTVGRHYSSDSFDDYSISAFKLVKDTKFLVMTLDEQIINAPAGHTMNSMNVGIFVNWVIASDYPEWMVTFCKFAYGAMPLVEQFGVFQEWMIGTMGQQGMVNWANWVKFDTQILQKLGVRTTEDGAENLTIASMVAMRKEYPKEIVEWQKTGDVGIVRKFRGFRWSTFEIDQVANHLLILFTQDQLPQVAGYMGGGIRRPQSLCGGESTEKCFEKGSTSSFASGSGAGYGQQVNGGDFDINTFDMKDFNTKLYYFHPEIVLWWAPDVLERTPDNPYDWRFGWNSNDIIDEMRKYQTTNIGFHHGHLAEHSLWTALYLNDWIRKPFFIDLLPYTHALIVAALLHDIGKMGECTTYDAFKPFLNTHQAATTTCQFKQIPGVTEASASHLEYDEIVDHPQIGYEYLSGRSKLREYKFIINAKHWREVTGADWDKYFRSFGFGTFQIKMIRVVVAMHWEWAPVITGVDTPNFSRNMETYINKFELYYHTEFGNTNKYRRIVLQACTLISLVDVLGSEAYKSIDNNATSVENCDFNTCKKWLKKWLPNLNPIVVAEQKPLIRRVLNNFEKSTILWDAPPQTSVYNNYDTLVKYMALPVSAFYGRLVVCFDFDDTLTLWNGDEYDWLDIPYQTLLTIQAWRPHIKIALVSHHWRPRLLEKWFAKYNYHTLFDYIISQYSGNNNEYHQQGVYMRNGEFLDMDVDTSSPQLRDSTKNFHFNLLHQWEPRCNLILVDDSETIIGNTNVPIIIAKNTSGKHYVTEDMLVNGIRIIMYKIDFFETAQEYDWQPDLPPVASGILPRPNRDRSLVELFYNGLNIF